MNHLEQLVAEWLQYRGYFVRVSVPVGPLPKGGFEGELDVVAWHPGNEHLVHVECSLDSLAWQKRQEKFGLKFERGRKYIRQVFKGVLLPETLEQIVVLQFAGRNSVRDVGGGRLVTVNEFIQEVFEGLRGTSPASGAVPSTLPLLRTMQLAAQSDRTAATNHRLVPIANER